MAGLDTDIEGEAIPQKNLRIGYLPQEPVLDVTKDVRGNVEEGVYDKRVLLTRFNEVSLRFAEPLDEDEMTALIESRANYRLKLMLWVPGNLTAISR